MKKWNVILISLTAMFFSSNALADDMIQAFNNTGRFWNSLFDVAYGLSLILGIVLSCKAGFEAIEVSKSHSGGNEKSYAKVYLYFFAGAMLLSSLSYIHTMMETLSLESIDASSAGEIFASNTGNDDSTIKAAISSVFLFLRFVGFAYTIIALTQLPKIGTNEKYTVAGVTTKFFGGILVMNMLAVIHIISETMGWEFII